MGYERLPSTTEPRGAPARGSNPARRRASLVAASVREAAQLVTRRGGALAAEWDDLRGVLGLLARRFGTRHHGLLARLAEMMRDTPLT